MTTFQRTRTSAGYHGNYHLAAGENKNLRKKEVFPSPEQDKPQDIWFNFTDKHFSQKLYGLPSQHSNMPSQHSNLTFCNNGGRGTSGNIHTFLSICTMMTCQLSRETNPDTNIEHSCIMNVLSFRTMSEAINK